MKTFNEWLKEKNIEENMADYTPGFIRNPLQSMGLMGKTSAQKKLSAELKARKENEKAAQGIDPEAHRIDNIERLRRAEIEQKADFARPPRKTVMQSTYTWKPNKAVDDPNDIWRKV
jgi:hypothetical protein